MSSLSFVPSISSLLEHPSLEFYKQQLSFVVVAYNIKKEVLDYKKEIQATPSICNGKIQAQEELVLRITRTLHRLYQSKTRPVINGTGVALHTNLGRSPLNLKILEQIQNTMTHYSSLEINLETGKRGKRKSLIPTILIHYLEQPEETTDVLVVNNNAAACLLLLSSLPRGKEVIISRGELVQIGGGFRIPDILEQSGLVLKEVGTTNITTLDDYKNAITENTALILKVHPSNFQIQGFTHSVSTKELAQICPPFCIFAVDQGSGMLKEDKFGETSVLSHLRDGAHLVLFSGDKLLGASQAGIVIGKKEPIHIMEKHPLMRVLRTGKMVSLYLEEFFVALANQSILPVGVGAISSSQGELQILAKRLCQKFPELLEVRETKRLLGGGTSPDFSTPSYGVVWKGKDGADTILEFFRNYKIPILGYIEQAEVFFDVSTFLEGDEDIFLSAVQDYLALREKR